MADWKDAVVLATLSLWDVRFVKVEEDIYVSREAVLESQNLSPTVFLDKLQEETQSLKDFVDRSIQMGKIKHFYYLTFELNGRKERGKILWELWVEENGEPVRPVRPEEVMENVCCIVVTKYVPKLPKPAK